LHRPSPFHSVGAQIASDVIVISKIRVTLVSANGTHNLERQILNLGKSSKGRNAVSIVRVGLAETKKFAQGYEAIFGKNASSSKASVKKSPAGKKKKKSKKK
jgi:hypothetical protein